MFGEGTADARVVFVGEGPGEEEDKSGRPFVGRAGELLTKMIEAVGWRREDVYICNIVKCRPPGNRDPRPIEVATCQPFLERQIRAIAPVAIVTLGKPAISTLLGRTVAITKLRGQLAGVAGHSRHADLPPGLPAAELHARDAPGGLGRPARRARACRSDRAS